VEGIVKEAARIERLREAAKNNGYIGGDIAWALEPREGDE